MPEITLIPKKEKPEIKIPFGKIFFYFPLILLILAILVLSVFYLYNHFILEKSIKAVQEEIDSINRQRDKTKDEEFLKEMFNLELKVRNFRSLLDNHVHASNIFSFFEQITLPKTAYFGFSTTTSGCSIKTTGQVDSIISLIKQMIVFSRNPLVKDAKVSNISLGPEGRIGFSLDLSFDCQLLRKEAPLRSEE